VWTLTFVRIRLEVDSGCGSHGGLVLVSEDERPLMPLLCQQPLFTRTAISIWNPLPVFKPEARERP